MASFDKSWDRGIIWGSPSTFTPFDSIGPSHRQAHWIGTSYFTDGGWDFDPYCYCDFTTADGVDSISGDYVHWSRIFRLNLSGINLITSGTDIIPGSKITRIVCGAKWGSAGVHQMRAKISSSSTFDNNWLDGGVAEGVNVNNRTFSYGGTSTSLYSDVSTNWQISQAEAWDFLAGDDFITSRMYMYFWYVHPDPTAIHFANDPWGNYKPSLKRFRINKVSWTEPSVGSGILLGNI